MMFEEKIPLIQKKYFQMCGSLDRQSADRVISSLKPHNSITEFHMTQSIIPFVKPSSIITVLASWFSIPLLDILVAQNIPFKKIFLLDHDDNVIKIGNSIKRVLQRGNSIQYIRIDVLFDNIIEYIDISDIILIPSINRLLPVNEIIPKNVYDKIVSISGNNDSFKAYNINPIYSIDDLREQSNFKNEYYHASFAERDAVNRLIKSFVLTGQI